MNSLVLPSAKDLGAFYTPDTIADVLAAWVVQTGEETLLEPSIGDGALLRSALARAAQETPGIVRLRLVGCDCDDRAIAGVRSWLSQSHTLIHGDFLEVDPSVIGTVDGVISNPPFTRNHALPKELRAGLRRRFSIRGAAGLWVAFLLHSMEFLSPGGRLAAVVPASAIFSTYGKEALTRICRRFEHVEVRQIVDKPIWSSHAEERGAIILARGFEIGTSLLPSPTIWSALGDRSDESHHEDSTYFRQAMLGATRLGELAVLSIGSVTGFNRVFLLSEAERVAARIEIDDLSLVAAKSRHASGLRISTAELRKLARQGERTWMLTPRDIAKDRSGVRSRLALISAEKRRTVVWLNKRKPWWRVEAGSGCDAIFTYMNDRGPRIVLAMDNVRCTNTLHQIWFSKSLTPDDRRVIALSMISSFGQLAAERIGRPYGGGVLKFELTDARRFPILLRGGASAKAAFAEADRAIRSGDMERARHVADALLLPSIFGAFWEDAADQMIAEAFRLRAVRRTPAKP